MHGTAIITEKPLCSVENQINVRFGRGTRPKLSVQRSGQISLQFESDDPSSYLAGRQYAPRAMTTAETVRARMYRSSHGDQLRM